MSKREILLLIIGLLFLLAGIVFNEWVLAYFTSDGRIDSTSQLFIIRAINITFIALGIALIIYRKSRIAAQLVASIIIMVIMFIVLDTILYFAAPVLPEQLVAAMSPHAQVRYYHANRDSQDWLSATNVRYARPNTEVELFNIPVKVDSLGYRNPQNYLESTAKIDVLLLGDSFIWGTEEETVADYLRETAAPLRIYSLGMAGSGIPQWSHHYQRFIDNNNGETPSVVVLNFFSGNDITDTAVFNGVKNAEGIVDSADYYAFLNYQFLIPSTNRSFSIPKLPEFLFLLNYSLAIIKSSPYADVRTVEIEDIQVPICLKGREPNPEEFDENLLQEINTVVTTIQNTAPDTEIVLSYIPTSGSLYGDKMDVCPDYGQDIVRQQQNSDKLSAFAAETNITYLDFTPTLREHAQSTSIWAENDHFSPAGYELYASLLADKLKLTLAEGY